MARPLGFDPDAAREALKQVFWARGYKATSMQDIEQATGLNKQSLYRQFGDKRRMYHAALRSYEECELAFAAAVLEATPGGARARFRVLLDGVLIQTVAAGDRRGCFLSNASAELDLDSSETAALVSAMTEGFADVFEATLRRAEPYASDAALARARARHLLASYVGLRVLLRGGLSLDDAQALVADLIAMI